MFDGDWHLRIAFDNLLEVLEGLVLRVLRIVGMCDDDLIRTSRTTSPVRSAACQDHGEGDCSPT